MRKTNEELNDMIAAQQALIADAAGSVDVHRGHISKACGQLIKNRREAIQALENQKELTTVNLRAGI